MVPLGCGIHSRGGYTTERCGKWGNGMIVVIELSAKQTLGPLLLASEVSELNN